VYAVRLRDGLISANGVLRCGSRGGGVAAAWRPLALGEEMTLTLASGVLSVAQGGACGSPRVVARGLEAHAGCRRFYVALEHADNSVRLLRVCSRAGDGGAAAAADAVPEEKQGGGARMAAGVPLTRCLL
jgi:hypothetical protein